MTIFSTSTSAFYERSRTGMTALRLKAETLQQQLGTGERLLRSSDDPVAASRLRTLARADRLTQIDTANAERAATDLTLTDTALTAFADTFARAKELAVQAGNDTLSPNQRTAIGTELHQIHGHLLSLANARDSAGHALFGGETAGDAYGLDGSGNAVYVGTGGTGDLALGDGQSVVGTRLAWIDFVTDRHQDLGELRAAKQADIGGTDLASTVTHLQQAMLVLEASQASFAKLSGLSLFDRLN